MDLNGFAPFTRAYVDGSYPGNGSYIGKSPAMWQAASPSNVQRSGYMVDGFARQAEVDGFRNSSSSSSSYPVASSPLPKVQQSGYGVHQCGQCQLKAAVHFCKDCNEFFCWDCGAAMHRRGNRTMHRLLEVEKTDSALPGQLSMVKPTGVLYCDIHPAEPVTCCCETCNMRTMCNICGISCAKAQHDVATLREMVQRLPASIAVLNSQVEQDISRFGLRLGGVSNDSSSCERILNLSVANCKQQIHSNVKLMQALMDADQDAYRLHVETLASEVRRSFEERACAFAPIVISQDQYQDMVGVNPVAALNQYARLQKTLENRQSSLTPRSALSSDDLQKQLKDGVGKLIETIVKMERATIEEMSDSQHPPEAESPQKEVHSSAFNLHVPHMFGKSSSATAPAPQSDSKKIEGGTNSTTAKGTPDSKKSEGGTNLMTSKGKPDNRKNEGSQKTGTLEHKGLGSIAQEQKQTYGLALGLTSQEHGQSNGLGGPSVSQANGLALGSTSQEQSQSKGLAGHHMSPETQHGKDAPEHSQSNGLIGTHTSPEINAKDNDSF